MLGWECSFFNCQFILWVAWLSNISRRFPAASTAANANITETRSELACPSQYFSKLKIPIIRRRFIVGTCKFKFYNARFIISFIFSCNLYAMLLDNNRKHKQIPMIYSRLYLLNNLFLTYRHMEVSHTEHSMAGCNFFHANLMGSGNNSRSPLSNTALSFHTGLGCSGLAQSEILKSIYINATKCNDNNVLRPVFISERGRKVQWLNT